MNEELKSALEALKTDFKGKTEAEVKSAIEAFEEKYKDEMAVEIKTAVDAVKSELEKELNEVKKHADALDIKLQEKNKSEKKESKDILVKTISENFEEIKTVRKGKSVEIKAVADMTLGNNLTGDQPRDYSFDVVTVPSQRINVSDLAQTVQISGGTYTFPKETGSEGSIGAQIEGLSKSQIDYDISMIDVNTDFIAGFARYSKKMANNLPFLESWLPTPLRRDYAKAENAAFNTTLVAEATASTLVAANFDTPLEMIIKEISTLNQSDYDVNGIVVSPTFWYNIQVSEKSTGAGYGFPGIVTMEGGFMRVNGVPIYQATWLTDANKYFVGDWSRVKKIVTQGLGLEFFEQDGDNVTKNLITARIEAQVALAVEQGEALIYGDFTAV